MLPYSESNTNEPKVWTKVSGYNNLVIFKKFPTRNTIDFTIHKYYIPYKSEN